MSNRHDTCDIVLYDEDYEGRELELFVTAYYFDCPAEPDVGIPHPYKELDFVVVDIPVLGKAYLHTEAWVDEDICEKLGETK